MAVGLHYWIKPIIKSMPKKLRNGMNNGGRNAFYISPILTILVINLLIVFPIGLAYAAWMYNKNLNFDTSSWD